MVGSLSGFVTDGVLWPESTVVVEFAAPFVVKVVLGPVLDANDVG